MKTQTKVPDTATQQPTDCGDGYSYLVGKDPVVFADSQTTVIPGKHPKVSRQPKGRHNGGTYLGSCPVVMMWLAACVAQNGPCLACDHRECCVFTYDKHQKEGSSMLCARNILSFYSIRPTPQNGAK